jgi:hypothetical protein
VRVGQLAVAPAHANMTPGSASPNGRSRLWFSPAPKPSRETLKFWTLSSWATRSSSWVVDDNDWTPRVGVTYRGGRVAVPSIARPNSEPHPRPTRLRHTDSDD